DRSKKQTVHAVGQIVTQASAYQPERARPVRVMRRLSPWATAGMAYIGPSAPFCRFVGGDVTHWLGIPRAVGGGGALVANASGRRSGACDQAAPAETKSQGNASGALCRGTRCPAATRGPPRFDNVRRAVRMKSIGHGVGDSLPGPGDHAHGSYVEAR